MHFEKSCFFDEKQYSLAFSTCAEVNTRVIGKQIPYYFARKKLYLWLVLETEYYDGIIFPPQMSAFMDEPKKVVVHCEIRSDLLSQV